MNILLLSMPNVIIAFNKACRFPSLGLSSIAGNLEGKHRVLIVDLVMLNKGDIKAFLYRMCKDFQPDIVGLSCFSFQYRTALEIAKLIKRTNNKVITVFGGYHPTLAYKMIPEEEFQYIDFIVRNEGEKTFNKLVNLLKRDEVYDIPGISYKYEGKIIHKPPVKVLDTEEINLPNRDVRFFKNYKAWGLKADVAETSRGCTFNCDICSITGMYGRTFRKFSVKRIIEDLKQMKKMGNRVIFFVDDNITLDLNHLEQVCDAIIYERLNDIHYITQSSVYGIASSAKIVRKMARAGFKTIFLGIENVSRKNLNFINKNTLVTEELTVQAVRYLKENKIIVLGSVIVGNPDDTEDDIWENFRFLKRLNVDAPLIFTPTPHIGTALRGKLIHQGYITNPDDLTWYNGVKANIRTKFLTTEKINKLVLKMYRSYPGFKYFFTNNILRNYPGYYIRRFFIELYEIISDYIKVIFGKLSVDLLKRAFQKDYERRKRWLLDDFQKKCDCCNCVYYRG